MGSTRAQGQADKTAGYAAEVSDKSGSKMLVSGFTFGYSYSYTRSNCMFACGESSDTTLNALPLNDGCGVTLTPLAQITSLTGIAPVASGSGFLGTVTFADGRAVKSRFGSFGGHTIYQVLGQSVLGKYSVTVAQLSRIVFQHDRDVAPLPEVKWGSSEAGKSSMSLVCKEGASIALTGARFYTTNSNGSPSGSQGIKIRVGESTIDMPSERLKALARKPEPNKENRYTLTTATGDSVDVQLQGEPYVGGDRDGRFFYVSLDELKELTVSR
jgi:hypothetical protein